MCMTWGCCRGGHTFVCLGCKTSAKGIDPKTFFSRNADPQRTNKTFHPRCPKCREPMLDVGLRARLPPRSKWHLVVAWVRGNIAAEAPRAPSLRPTPRKNRPQA